MIVEAATLMCLSMNIFHEARNQPIVGQIAVAQVVQNRVKDSRYPNTTCEVVEQGPTRESWKRNKVFYPIKHRCQFSWYCDGKSDKVTDMKAFKLAKTIAYGILSGQVYDITNGATHYHADYVFPAWRTSKTKTLTVGDHIFYRWEK